MNYFPTKVLIVHPKSFASELLARALSRVPRYKVLSLVTSCEDLPEVLETSQVDVMLISHKMLQASSDGLGTLRALRSEYPSLKTVLLLEDRTPNVVMESFRVGAKGVFCVGSGEFDSLCRCIDVVRDGKIWASNEELKWVRPVLQPTTILTLPRRDAMSAPPARSAQLISLQQGWS